MGVVIGLGVGRVVMSISQDVARHERVRFVHALWATLLLLMLVGLWWISWELRHVDAERWSFFTFLYLLVGPVLILLPSIMLLPDVPETGELDLGAVPDPRRPDARSGRGEDGPIYTLTGRDGKIRVLPPPVPLAGCGNPSTRRRRVVRSTGLPISWGRPHRNRRMPW